MTDEERAINDEHKPVYMISVVAEMLSVHPQTLRLYEREGFIFPSRTGGQRLYSQADVKRLGFILSLTRELGVNRAGVEIILRMRQRLHGLQEEVEKMITFLEDDKQQQFTEKIRLIFLDEEER